MDYCVTAYSKTAQCTEGCEVAAARMRGEHGQVSKCQRVQERQPSQSSTVAVDDHTASDWFTKAHQEYRDMKDGGQGSYAGFPQTDILDHCCAILYEAYKAHCYQVGSSLETKAFRDVDVRMIMKDEKYNRLFGTVACSPMWSVTCVSITAWLRQQTGLPIDFQIQRQSSANARHKGQRNALGMIGRMHLEGDQLPEFLRDLPKPDC